MALLITREQLPLYKNTESNVPCICENCNENFTVSKSVAYRVFKGTKVAKYCSHKCKRDGQRNALNINCSNCNKIISKVPSKMKSSNLFCDHSCAATFQNKNKTYGTRRSKLEVFLEKELTQLYPELEIHFNRKDTINSELDIYIPSLKLAFELNGVFHYEPIYGPDKLSQIQNNDDRKFQACLERGIELCIIDTSQHSYVTAKTNQKFLDIVTKIILLKL